MEARVPRAKPVLKVQLVPRAKPVLKVQLVPRAKPVLKVQLVPRAKPVLRDRNTRRLSKSWISWLLLSSLISLTLPRMEHDHVRLCSHAVSALQGRL